MKKQKLRHTLRPAVSCIGALMVLTSAVACGSSGSSSATPGTNTSSTSTTGSSAPSNVSAGVAQANTVLGSAEKPTTTIAQTVPLPSAPPKGKTIVYLYDGTVTSQTILASEVKAAAAAIGWNYDGITFEQSNPATLLAGLQAALVKHPTVVASAAQQYSMFGSSIISAYKAANIPLIFGGQASPLPADKLLIGNPGGPQMYQLGGKDLAAWFVAHSKGQGNVLDVNIPALTTLNPLFSAFDSEVKQLCSGCQITHVNMTIAQATGGQQASVVVTALQRNPSYKYVLYSDGAFASGITSAIASAGLSGIQVFGYDMLAEQAAGLQAGTIAAWAGLNLKTYACELVDLALRYVENTTDGVSNDDVMPTEILTPQNIGNQSTWDDPPNVLQLYEKIWQVPATQ
jgi:ABC-type sugar transport system substrate-binding protein